MKKLWNSKREGAIVCWIQLKFITSILHCLINPFLSVKNISFSAPSCFSRDWNWTEWNKIFFLVTSIRRFVFDFSFNTQRKNFIVVTFDFKAARSLEKFLVQFSLSRVCVAHLKGKNFLLKEIFPRRWIRQKQKQTAREKVDCKINKKKKSLQDVRVKLFRLESPLPLSLIHHSSFSSSACVTRTRCSTKSRCEIRVVSKILTFLWEFDQICRLAGTVWHELYAETSSMIRSLAKRCRPASLARRTIARGRMGKDKNIVINFPRPFL